MQTWMSDYLLALKKVYFGCVPHLQQSWALHAIMFTTIVKMIPPHDLLKSGQQQLAKGL